jgi:hypothetical protein
MISDFERLDRKRFLLDLEEPAARKAARLF